MVTLSSSLMPTSPRVYFRIYSRRLHWDTEAQTREAQDFSEAGSAQKGGVIVDLMCLLC